MAAAGNARLRYGVPVFFWAVTVSVTLAPSGTVKKVIRRQSRHLTLGHRPASGVEQDKAGATAKSRLQLIFPSMTEKGFPNPMVKAYLDHFLTCHEARSNWKMGQNR